MCMNSTTLRPQYVIKTDDIVYRRIHLGVNANIEQKLLKENRYAHIKLITTYKLGFLIHFLHKMGTACTF